VALSELAENAHVATNSQDLQDDDSFEDTPQVTHNQFESVSNSESDLPSVTQITTWSVNTSEENTPRTPLPKTTPKRVNNNQLSDSDSEHSYSSDYERKIAAENDFFTNKDNSEEEVEISLEAKVYSPPTRPPTNQFLRKHNKKAYKNLTNSQTRKKQLTPTMRIVKYPIPEQEFPLSRRDTFATKDNSNDNSQSNNKERVNIAREYPDNNLSEQYRISIRFGKVEKGMRNIPSPISHLLFFLNSWATLDPDIHPVFYTGPNI